MPFSTMPKGSPAAKLWESIYNASKKAGDTEEVAARKAWSGIQSAGYRKIEGKWIKTKALAEFSMAMMKGADMRWRMTASDTKKDAYDERMTLPLYHSFIENINDKKEIPEAFKSLVTSDYWKGGMPYVSVSHYPDLNGEGVPGLPETVYIDGETFKAKGKFFPTKLGETCYKALCNDVNTPADKKIRVSIAFLDLAHQHGDSPVFKRNSLTDICPQCEDGVGEKKYLDGYLVHFAMTRVPVNKRANMEVEKSMTTRREDAESIIDPELAEELEKKAQLVGKSDAVVEFSETSASETSAPETVLPSALENVEVLPETDNPNPPDEPIVAQSEVAPPVTIAVTNPVEDQPPPRINPQVWVVGKGQEALDIMFVELNRVLDDIFLRPDMQADMRKSSVKTIFEDLKNYVSIKPSMIAEPLFALLDAVMSAKSMIGTDEEKLTSVQPALNAVGDAIKMEVAPPKPVDPKDEAIATLSQSIEEMKNEMAVMKAQFTQQPRQIVPAVAPKPRSASPALVRSLVQQSQAAQPKRTSVEQLVRQRAGLSN
jgi:hypothetical protein